jgi:hypothetical protein
MSNKAHLHPHRKKRQASRATGLLLVIGFIALVVLATAMVASGHVMPTGRIIPLRGAVVPGLPGLQGVGGPRAIRLFCYGRPHAYRSDTHPGQHPGPEGRDQQAAAR